MPSCLFFFLFLSSDIIVFLLFEYYNILTMFVHFHFVDEKDIEAALSDKLFVYICNYHFWGSSCTNSEIFLHLNLFSSLPSFNSFFWFFNSHELFICLGLCTHTHCHELFIYTHELKCQCIF